MYSGMSLVLFVGEAFEALLPQLIQAMNPVLINVLLLWSEISLAHWYCQIRCALKNLQIIGYRSNETLELIQSLQFRDISLTREACRNYQKFALRQTPANGRDMPCSFLCMEVPPNDDSPKGAILAQV